LPEFNVFPARPAADWVVREQKGAPMDERRHRLLSIIEEAFSGIELGDGVSLHETVVIDNYGSLKERQAARQPDEKHDWKQLVGDPELVQISGVGGLSFYDAAGLRFHLPAYLSLAVMDFDREDAGNVLEDFMFHLTHVCEYNVGRFSVLNHAQRQCVRDVLIFLRGEYELESVELDQAIEGYWTSGTVVAGQAEGAKESGAN
jgi:hypothetical protein